MNGIDDILRELRRENVKKQDNYTRMMKWIKEEVAKIDESEVHSDTLIKIACELEKQIALARDIEVTQEHIGLVEINRG